MLFAALLVVKENAEHEHEAGSGSQQEKDHREARIAEDAKRRLNSHQHCGAHDQRSDNKTESNSIRDFLKSLQNDFLINRIDLETKLVVSGSIDRPISLT